MLRDADPAINDGKERKDTQRSGHRPWGFLRVLSLLCARFAEEGQGDLAHCVEGGQESGESQ